MGFYVIDKYNTIKISSGYFTIYSKKYFYSDVDFFDINSYNENFELFIFVYDYEDFYNIIMLSDYKIKFKIIVMNKFLNNQLRNTKNIDYVYIHEFVYRLKDYILELKEVEKN